MNIAAKLASLLVLIIIGISSLYSQPWMEGLTPAQQQNFYDIQRAFNQYWQGKDTAEKGKGWKQFKRWEWFWEQRVFPTGEFPDPMQLLNERRQFERTHKKNGERTFSGNWSELGPSSSPGGYSGLGRLNCVRVNPNDNTIWVGSASGGLWKSTNGGGTWDSNTDEFPSLGVTDIVINPSNDDIMYIGTGDGDASDTYSVGVLKSTDGGVTWNTTGLNWSTSQVRTISRVLIHPTNPNILLAAGNGIHKTTDAGATWVQVLAGTFKDMEFKPGSPDVMYASGSSSQIFRSTNGGSSWTQLTAGLPTNGARIALGVSPANPDYVYALVAASNSGLYGVYRSVNSGDSWSLRSNSPNLLGWAADGSDQGGQGWYDLCLAVSPFDAEEVYTGGINVWKSTNGGTNWTLVTFWYNIGIPEVHADQHDLFFVPGTYTLYSGNDGGIYRTTDGGTSWSWLGTGLRTTQFYRLGISATNPNFLIAGSQDNGSKTANVPSWYDVLGGDGMECIVDHTNASIVYGTLYYGDIYKSYNGGSGFFPITGSITETGAWITPYVMHPTNPQVLYAGYTNVWKTVDGGASWQTISNTGGGTKTILNVAPSDPNVIYVSAGSGFFKTTDGGASGWISVPHPSGAGTLTYLAIHPADPGHLWVTASGYTAGRKVYESTNGGTTWTNISGSLPNVPTNCIVYQTDTPDRIYVGTDIGVYYRDMTTADWQDFNTGLANVIVNELEIQYAVNKVRAATYGRGIWESEVVLNQGIVIIPSPLSIAFGRQEAGFVSDTVALTITNYGTDTLRISAVSIPGSGFNILNVPPLPAALGPLGSTAISVFFSPQSHGDALDSIVVTSNATNAPIMPIRLSGRGVVIGRADVGVMYASAFSATSESQLYTINTTTGAPAAIGSTGLNEIQTLSIRPSTKELYGTLSTPTSTTIYRVSKSSGDALTVRMFALPYMRAIAFADNGDLYGAIGSGTGTGRLYRLDLVSGDTTYVGTAANISYSGLAFSPASHLLWAGVRPPVAGRDRIYTVNTATGAATLIGSTGFSTRITAGLAFDASGQLYGITGASTQVNELIRIDTLTAAGTLVGSTGLSGLTGIAMRSDSIVTSVRDLGGPLPASYSLLQNYPNPFNPVTQFEFRISESGLISLTVYDVLGREVALLVNEQMKAGNYSVTFDARDLSTGVYYYRLVALDRSGKGIFSGVKKMVVVR